MSRLGINDKKGTSIQGFAEAHLKMCEGITIFPIIIRLYAGNLGEYAEQILADYEGFGINPSWTELMEEIKKSRKKHG
jgi:hypothetical protein